MTCCWLRRAAVALVGGAAGRATVAPSGRFRARPNGKPDLSGIWVATGAIMLFEGQEAFAAARAADAAAGRPPGNTNEAPPYKPEAEAQRQYFLSRQGIDDPMARCLLTGVPRINFRPLPFEIVQLPDRVIMLYEIHHAFRIIPTDGRPPPEDAEPSYLGESVGHWDGDTFVVDVTSFNTKRGSRASARSTRRTCASRSATRATRSTRSATRSRWKIPPCSRGRGRSRDFRLRPGERIREYECIESNEDLQRFERLLQESRATEKLREPLRRRQLVELRPRVRDLVPRRLRSDVEMHGR